MKVFNIQIIELQQDLLGLYKNKLEEFRDASSQLLEEILHQANELRKSETFTERTAAEIVYAAATTAIELKDKK